MVTSHTALAQSKSLATPNLCGSQGTHTIACNDEPRELVIAAAGHQWQGAHATSNGPNSLRSKALAKLDPGPDLTVWF